MKQFLMHEKMDSSRISSSQLKRYIRHLCIVTKHYYERDAARNELYSHISRINKASDTDKTIALLNRKINILMEKETRVAELGIGKNIPASLLKKIRFLEQEVELLQEERDRLLQDNKDLRKGIESISEIWSAVDEVHKTKRETEKRVKEIKENVDERYREFIIRELNEKIALLESSYKKISRDKSISPARLFKIEQKLKEYKDKLKKINNS